MKQSQPERKKSQKRNSAMGARKTEELEPEQMDAEMGGETDIFDNFSAEEDRPYKPTFWGKVTIFSNIG